jgi:hypothetical protein
MPVSGIPDPEKHWICIKCGQWFEADEGQMIQLERSNPVGKLADAISGDVRMRFRCDGCAARQARNRVIFIGVLTIVLLACVVALNLKASR